MINIQMKGRNVKYSVARFVSPINEVKKLLKKVL
jgi:hypothetical protein